MTSPKHKRPLAPTLGVGVLMVQAMSAPFAFASAFTPTPNQAPWATGLFLAADLGAVASLLLVAFGRHTHHVRARFAPATLVLPMWVTIALLSPLQHDNLGGAAMYSLYALLVGVMSSLPFMTKDAEALFEATVPDAPRVVVTAGPSA